MPIPTSTVILPRSLVALFPGCPRRLAVEGATVGALVRELDRSWPGMADRLCGPGPALRPFINVFVDGVPAAIDAIVPDGATVHVLPAIAGG